LPTLPSGSIVADHVWKRFRADRAKPRLHDQLARIGRQVRGQRRGWRWALKDINVEVEPGETVALVGVNGSGKSTLLKVISHVTYQSAGHCETSGRIGALLEVRSGINPVLSGRENIYLYGNILGLSKRQITERFDTIVEFAELTDAIDRQVKYFSSGMQVRLGFAIAAYLEPDILLVDEVLAVGDANFQQKCLQRIGEVVADGTTLLFVSHDLAAVEAMCERAVWLADAVVRAQGPTREVLSLYRGALKEDAALATPTEAGVRALKVEIAATDGGPVRTGGDVEVRMTLRSPRAGGARFFIGVSEGTAMPIFVAGHDSSFPEGDFELRCVLRNLPVPRGKYYLWAVVSSNRVGGPKLYMSWRPVASFDVLGVVPAKPPVGVMVLSPVHVDATWEVG
jgi:ABC-2 type transport system ATP-binding protein